MLTCVVLTFNEEKHLGRCLASVRAACDEIVVVDSHSTDRTADIAREAGARVCARPFVNQADQFNWALAHTEIKPGWVLRIDADEYVDADLLDALKALRRRPAPEPCSGSDPSGFSVVRRIHFMDRTLQHGGLGRVRSVRVFAFGSGRSEQRWMDEHIVVDGPVRPLPGLLVDHNLNTLTWWIAKHNQYASREVIDICLASQRQSAPVPHGKAGLKRWLKQAVFYRLPPLVAPVLYFLLRYVIQLGFLDGRAGAYFHFHQGLWYRTLVTSKLDEVRLLQRRHGLSLEQALNRVTGYCIK